VERPALPVLMLTACPALLRTDARPAMTQPSYLNRTEAARLPALTASTPLASPTSAEDATSAVTSAQLPVNASAAPRVSSCTRRNVSRPALLVTLPSVETVLNALKATVLPASPTALINVLSARPLLFS